VRNFLGQQFQVGDAVWRGAREGNRSSFKAGHVAKVGRDSITVSWLWTDGTLGIVNPADGKWMSVNIPWPVKSTGTIKDANSLVLIDDDFSYCEFWYGKWKELRADEDNQFLYDQIANHFL
jgi:hypothetical protein